MIRFAFKFILCVLLALAAGFIILAVRSGDPIYTFYEWISPARFHQYDSLIRFVALENHIAPCSIGNGSPIRCRLRSLNIMPAPVVPNAGPVAMRPLK